MCERPENIHTYEIDWDDAPSESSMEKANGGWTCECPFCDGSGIKDGEPCFSCGGTGWRR